MLCLRLPLQIRSVVSDFCVFIAIVIVTGCDALVGIGTPKLITPAKFAVSSMSYRLFVILHIYPLGLKPICKKEALTSMG